MLCVIWLDWKYCGWTCATATLYINIYLHRECCKTTFTHCFIVTSKKLIWLVFFFIFLFMVTSRQIIFICSTAVGSLESLLLNNKVFWFHLSWRCSGSFARIMHIISGVSKRLYWLSTPIVWHFIRKLNKVSKVSKVPGYKCCTSLISFLYDENMVCRFPYCGSSIFFSNDSWNIDMKCVKSSGFPSRGSISTCGADCSLPTLIAFLQHYHFHALISVVFSYC